MLSLLSRGTRHLGPARLSLAGFTTSLTPRIPIYVVSVGREPGKYPSWDLAEPQVKGYPGAKHQKCATDAEADAYLRGEVHIERASTETDTVAYVDGSYLPQLGTAGIGVYWQGLPDVADLSERLLWKVSGTALPPIQLTNNQAELYAIIRVFEADPHPHRILHIYSDSQYAIDWLQMAYTMKPRTPNQELIKMARYLRSQRSGVVKFHKSIGHCNTRGNKLAHDLATEGAQRSDAIARDFDSELQSLLKRNRPQRKKKKKKVKRNKGKVAAEILPSVLCCEAV